MVSSIYVRLYIPFTSQIHVQKFRPFSHTTHVVFNQLDVSHQSSYTIGVQIFVTLLGSPCLAPSQATSFLSFFWSVVLASFWHRSSCDPNIFYDVADPLTTSNAVSRGSKSTILRKRLVQRQDVANRHDAQGPSVLSPSANPSRLGGKVQEPALVIILPTRPRLKSTAQYIWLLLNDTLLRHGFHSWSKRARIRCPAPYPKLCGCSIA